MESQHGDAQVFHCRCFLLISFLAIRVIVRWPVHVDCRVLFLVDEVGLRAALLVHFLGGDLSAAIHYDFEFDAGSAQFRDDVTQS